MARKIEFTNLDNLIRRYQTGTSAKQLAGELGITRAPLLRALRDAGVDIRGRSEAELTKWRFMKADPARIERQLGRAWRRRRGQKDSESVLSERATTLARMKKRIGRYERELSEVAAPVLPLDVQVAIGTFCVDLGNQAERIAVEIQCSHHRDAQSSIRRERLEHILDRGWTLLVVYVPQHARMDLPRVGEKLITWLKLVRSAPTLRGQYGMVGRNGQPVSPRGLDLPRRPRIAGL